MVGGSSWYRGKIVQGEGAPQGRRPQAAGTGGARHTARRAVPCGAAGRGAGACRRVQGPAGEGGPQAQPPGGRFRRAEPDGFGGAETACGPVSAPCRGLRRAKKKSPAKARPFPTKIILPSVVLQTGNSLKGRWWRHRFSLSLSLLYARGRENSAFLIENWVTIW